MHQHTALRCDRIQSFDVLGGIADEWRQLAAASGTPFASFEWARAWWTHYQENTVAIEDRLDLHVFRSPAGELVAVAPLILTRRLQITPFELRQLHFLGADPNITELRGLVARPEWRVRAYQALLETTLARSTEWDWFMCNGLPAGVTALDLPLHGARFEWSRDLPLYELPLPATWAELQEGFSRNLRESLRKCYNSLKRDGRTFELLVCSNPAHVPEALQHFCALHSARAGVDGTVRHADLFCDAPARPFLIDVCERFARRGDLRVFLLRVDGAIVAARIGFCVGDTLYLYYSGYDPAYGRYSVMTTLVAEAIKYAIESGFRRVNLSSGRDVSKTRWRPDEVLYREALIVSPAARSAVAHSVYRHVKAGLGGLPLIRALSRRSAAATS